MMFYLAQALLLALATSLICNVTAPAPKSGAKGVAPQHGAPHTSPHGPHALNKATSKNVVPPVGQPGHGSKPAAVHGAAPAIHPSKIVPAHGSAPAIHPSKIVPAHGSAPAIHPSKIVPAHGSTGGIAKESPEKYLHLINAFVKNYGKEGVQKELNKLTSVLEKVRKNLCPAKKAEKLVKDECAHCKKLTPDEHKEFSMKLMELVKTENEKHKKSALKALAGNPQFTNFAVCAIHLTWNVTEKGHAAVEKAEKAAHLTPVQELNSLPVKWYQDENNCLKAIKGISELSGHMKNKKAKISHHVAHDGEEGHKIHVGPHGQNSDPTPAMDQVAALHDPHAAKQGGSAQALKAGSMPVSAHQTKQATGTGLTNDNASSVVGYPQHITVKKDRNLSGNHLLIHNPPPRLYLPGNPADNPETQHLPKILVDNSPKTQDFPIPSAFSLHPLDRNLQETQNFEHSSPEAHNFSTINDESMLENHDSLNKQDDYEHATNDLPKVAAENSELKESLHQAHAEIAEKTKDLNNLAAQKEELEQSLLQKNQEKNEVAEKKSELEAENAELKSILANQEVQEKEAVLDGAKVVKESTEQDLKETSENPFEVNAVLDQPAPKDVDANNVDPAEHPIQNDMPEDI